MSEPQLNLEGAVMMLRAIERRENTQMDVPIVKPQNPNPILINFESWALSQGLDPQTALNVVVSGMTATVGRS